jgi:hypothetical protein
MRTTSKLGIRELGWPYNLTVAAESVYDNGVLNRARVVELADTQG